MITITIQANTPQEAFEQMRMAAQEFSTPERVLTITHNNTAPVKMPTVELEPAPAEDEPTEETAVAVTIEDVRAALVDLRKRTNGAKAKALLQQFGVSGVSELQEAQYADVIHAAKEAV